MTDCTTAQRQHVLNSQRTNSLTGIQIIGSGTHVPDNVVSNAELNKRFGFDPNWISERTGILERRHAPANVSSLEMAVAAAEKAIRNAGDRSQVDRPADRRNVYSGLSVSIDSLPGAEPSGSRLSSV